MAAQNKRPRRKLFNLKVSVFLVGHHFYKGDQNGCR